MPKSYTTFFILGAAISAVFLTVASLSFGWVITNGRAEQSAREASNQAVIEQLVPFCLHQFHAQHDSTARLADLRGLDRWQRESVVAAEGWATVPGASSPATGVVRACAERLVEDPA